MIEKVEIVPVKPNNGLISFASLLLNGNLYLGSIGVFKRRDGSGCRILFPTKKGGQQQLCVYHPTNEKLSKEIELAVCERAREIFKD